MPGRSPRANSGKSFKTYSRRTGWKGCSASDLRTRTIHGAVARLVRDSRPPPSALARESHAVPRMGIGGHAAADSGRDRDSVLPALHGAISGRGVARGGAAG